MVPILEVEEWPLHCKTAQRLLLCQQFCEVVNILKSFVFTAEKADAILQYAQVKLSITTTS